ncbi:MAG: DNA-processing protein DprA, partial [Patescibacteria group bacterium]|nr:DNA-processing protein DprA [Patescibacteria group bacterium]
MVSDERFYYLAFSCFEEGIGPMRFQLLLNYFKSAKNAWLGKQTELQSAGIPQSIIEKFLEFKTKFDLEKYLQDLAKKEISFITIEDENYPYLLKQISDPPFVLYVKGSCSFFACAKERTKENTPRASSPVTLEPRQQGSPSGIPSLRLGQFPFSSADSASVTMPTTQKGSDENNFWLSDNKIAVVGTRTPTSYGRQVTEILTAQLAVAGLTIVSGMARGVDTLAHRTAMENGAKTIAVLGCGVDLIYPPENKELYYQISRGNGCVIS